MKNLAVVDGEGKNSIWFAKQDVDVVSVDYSLNGLKKAKKLVQKENVSLNTICINLLE